jgi:hypothetical protein
MDNIVVDGPTIEKAVLRLALVFSRLRAAYLKLKPVKCNLYQKTVTFLGHVVEERGIVMNPEKVSVIMD